MKHPPPPKWHVGGLLAFVDVCQQDGSRVPASEHPRLVQRLDLVRELHDLYWRVEVKKESRKEPKQRTEEGVADFLALRPRRDREREKPLWCLMSKVHELKELAAREDSLDPMTPLKRTRESVRMSEEGTNSWWAE